MNDPVCQGRPANSQDSAPRPRAPFLAEAPWVLISLVLLLTFLAYSGTLWFKFVYDDRGQILANVQVHSWRFLPHYFFERVWSFAYPGIPG
ncbi:MAG TPA: hypothetical protein VNG91_01815, partial [Terriglobia bacterium]|nr:hypothetical protein [Terriglobia bacterium]